MRRAMILGFCLLASLAACDHEALTGVNPPATPGNNRNHSVGNGNGGLDWTDATASTPFGRRGVSSFFGGGRPVGIGAERPPFPRTNEDEQGSEKSGIIAGSGN